MVSACFLFLLLQPHLFLLLFQAFRLLYAVLLPKKPLLLILLFLLASNGFGLLLFLLLQPQFVPAAVSGVQAALCGPSAEEASASDLALPVAEVPGASCHSLVSDGPAVPFRSDRFVPVSHLPGHVGCPVVFSAVHPGRAVAVTLGSFGALLAVSGLLLVVSRPPGPVAGLCVLPHPSRRKAAFRGSAASDGAASDPRRRGPPTAAGAARSRHFPSSSFLLFRVLLFRSLIQHVFGLVSLRFQALPRVEGLLELAESILQFPLFLRIGKLPEVLFQSVELSGVEYVRGGGGLAFLKLTNEPLLDFLLIAGSFSFVS